jgi:hypothetical protein
MPALLKDRNTISGTRATGSTWIQFCGIREEWDIVYLQRRIY